MVKSELQKLLAERHEELPAQVAEILVNMTFQIMSDALLRGEEIEIRGFGMFRLKHTNPKLVRNPKTGERIYKSAGKSIQFKAGKEIQQLIQTHEKI